MPPMRIRTLQNDLNQSIGWVTLSFDGAVVLLDDVVQVFVLAHQDVNEGIDLQTFNGCCIGAALVDGELLGHAVQVDSALQKAPVCGLISLGWQ